jgi:hypothetical protein
MGKKLSFLKYHFFHFTHQNSGHMAGSVLLLFQSETTLYCCWINLYSSGFVVSPSHNQFLYSVSPYGGGGGVSVCVISSFLKKFLTREDVTNKLSRNAGNNTEERRSHIAV